MAWLSTFAALLGGASKAAQILAHFLGLINVDAPSAQEVAPAGVQTAIDSHTALAITYGPSTENFQNGQFAGPSFNTCIRGDVAGDSLSKQLTVEMHELIHVATPGNIYSLHLVDLGNMYNQKTNIYDISKNCGTALPPNY